MPKQLIKQSGIYLFKLFNFEVRLDWSWFILAILVFATLAFVYFPAGYPGLSRTTYLIMSLIGTVGLFGSIVLHEICHSIVGRYYGLPIDGITLFIFGGIAKMHSEPPNPKAEFYMAAAGPLFSFLFGLLFVFLTFITLKLKLPLSVIGICAYLAMINLVIAIFNLLPGYPLDGGRILRALLWWWKKDLRLATKIASRIGITISFGLIIVGILLFLYQDIIGGVWLVLLGLFLFQIAKMSFRQLIAKEIFADQTLSQYIVANDFAVSPHISIEECIQNYFYTSFQRFYAVVYDQKVIGCITLETVALVHKKNRLNIEVKDIMQEVPSDILLDADSKMRDVVNTLITLKLDFIIVVKKDKYFATVSRSKMADIINIKNSLDGEELS